MRKSYLAISAATGAVALAFLSPGLATAADTTATFSVVAGGIEVTADGTSALTVSGAAGSAQEATGTVADITVTDNRQGVLDWTASAVSTPFTSASDSVPATEVDYVATGVGFTGTVTAAAEAESALATVVPVLNATAVSGANTVTWTGGVTVTLPSDVLAGDYSGTITHSVV